MASAFDLILTFLIITLGYGSLCSVSPFGACRKCKGWGAKVRTTRTGRLKRGRECRRCDGYGRRVRVGRRLYNVAIRLHRQAGH